ncbi:50S ribosomal protein L31 [Vibrio chagasii]|nr:50S ribosomal protein L31 [Vibrio chagasii]
MKPNIHPDYRTVVFHDTSVDEYFLIEFNLENGPYDRMEDGNTYPLLHYRSGSSKSHPFYTGNRECYIKKVVANFTRHGQLGKGAK